MGDSDDLSKKVEKMSPRYGAHRLNGKVKKALVQNLGPDEEIMAIVHGAHGQAIVGTRSRLFVLKPGFMAGASFGAEVTSWNYAAIAGIQVHKGLMSGAVVVQGPGQKGVKTSYWSQDKDSPAKAPNAIPVAGDWDQVHASVARLRELLNAAHSPSTEVAPPSPISVADELSKLAELRASGALTDDEFAAAKHRLLG